MGEATTFHELVADLSYPMVVVTAVATDDGEVGGCLVGFSTQCSIDPPRFLVLLSDKNHTYRVARRADVLAVHFLTVDDRDLAVLFGEETGDRTDKLARTPWHPGPGGVPILDGCPTWFAGRIVGRVGGGDHQGFLLDPLAAGKGRDIVQLGFQDVKGLDPGHPA